MKLSKWAPTRKQLGQLKRYWQGTEQLVALKNGGVMIRRKVL
jgi:hypothetical protein